MTVVAVPALVAAWLGAGALAGLGVARANRWLAGREELEAAPGRVQAFGPAVLLALLFAALAWRLAAHPEVLAVRSLWAVVLVQVIFFDLAHRLVLDRVMFPAWPLALVLSLVTGDPGWRWSLVGGVGAGVAFGLIALIGALAFRAEVLGMGDVKLAIFIGLVAGPWTAAALLLGVVLAGVMSILLIATRIKGLRDTIAYGPYLCAGTLVVLLQHVPR